MSPQTSGDVPGEHADFANPDTELARRSNAVVTSEGNHLKVYEGDCVESDVLGQLNSGARVLVIDGPFAVEGSAWWRVRHEGLIGWVIEGQDNEIWLQGA